MSRLTIELSDLRLFGNDAAEDEEEAIFRAHILERSELHRFIDEGVRLCIVHAYKGEGKSALLRMTGLRLTSAASAPLVVASAANAIVPAVEVLDFSQWVRGWKAAILDRIAVEVGSRIGLAWRSDARSLVEEAEKQGFRSRNPIGWILDRIESVKVSGLGVEIETRRPEPGVANAEPTLRRWAEREAPFWFILDDIDQNFQNIPLHRMRVAACFVAMRELMQAIPQMRIRAAVRPNVWVAVKHEFEALSHVEQYLVRLTWEERDIRDLLAKRVEGYLKLTSQSGLLSRFDERGLIALVFQDPMEWNRAGRPPHVPLYTLSKRRPRWVIELSKTAANRAVQEGHTVITVDDLTSVLYEFGKRRIEDTIAEFRSQCEDVEELIVAFRNEAEQMTTAELYTVINNKVLNHLNPRISGVLGKASASDVASLLFEIGFFYGRVDHPDGTYSHVTQANRYHVFRSRTNRDDGLRWEVHPVFRQFLEMRDWEGREVGRRRRGRSSPRRPRR